MKYHNPEIRFQESSTNFFEQMFNPINILNSLFMQPMMPMMMIVPMQMPIPTQMVSVSVIEMSSLRNENNYMSQISRVNNLSNSPFFSISTL